MPSYRIKLSQAQTIEGMEMIQFYITLYEEDLHHLFSSNDERLKSHRTIDQSTPGTTAYEADQCKALLAYRAKKSGTRNRCKGRRLTTKVRTLTLKVPQMRRNH